MLFSFIAAAPLWAGRVEPIQEFVRELSSSAGFKIEVADNLKNDLIFIEPHGAAINGILSAVASALHASVKGGPIGYKIERTGRDLAQLHEERARERAAWITRRIEHVRSYRARTVGKGSIAGAFFAAERQEESQLNDTSKGLRAGVAPFWPTAVLPAEELLEGLVLRIGASELAALPSRRTLVFEDEPSGTVRALPEHQDLLDAFERQMAPLRSVTIPPITPGTSIISRIYQPFAADWANANPLRHIRVVETATENQVSFELEGFDAAGCHVTHARLDAGPVDGQQTPRELMFGADKRANTQYVALSYEAEAARNFGRSLVKGNLPDWFLHPDKKEPMNLFVREALEGIAARSPDEPVVVAVSDALWINVDQCTKDGRVNIDGLVATVRQWTPYECIENGGAALWRPKDCEIDERLHADRKVLAHFAQDFGAIRQADIRLVAKFIHDASLEGAQLSNLWSLTAQQATISPPFVMCTLDGCLRILGAVPDDLWPALKKGTRMTVGELGIGQEVQAFLEDTEAPETAMQGYVTDLERHPSTLVRNGLSPETPFVLRPDSSPQIRLWYGGQPGGAIPPDGLKRISQLRGGQFRWDGDTPSTDVSREQFEVAFLRYRYQYVSQERYELTIGASDLSLGGSVSGCLEATSDQFDYSDFPQSLRDAVWAHAYAAGLSAARDLRAHPPISTPLIPSVPVVPPPY